MARRKIIALVGIDGAGKTTLAKNLAEWLNAVGAPAEYSENPGGRVAIDRLARRLGRRDGIDLLGRNMFLVTEATTRWLAIARGLLVSRQRNRVAIMDRYAYCQYVVIRARGDRCERMARLCYKVFPKPDVVCFIGVPPKEAKRRIDARGYDEEDLAHLEALDNAYRHLPEFGGFEVIDGDAPPEIVAARLRETVAAKLKIDPTVRAVS